MLCPEKLSMSTHTASWLSYTNVLANLAVIVGVPLFIMSTYLSEKQAAADASLQLFIAFQSGAGGEARQQVAAALWDYPQVIALESVDKNDYTAFLRELSIADPTIVSNLSAIDYWLRLAFECQNRGSCDPISNARLFGPVVAGLNCLYQPMYTEWAEQFSIDDFGYYISFYSESYDC